MRHPTTTATEHEGYELFRRAISDRDEHAWAVIYVRYRSLLIYWAHRSAVRYAIHETIDDVADQAFARAWMALTSERFGQFPTLGTLLGYLRTCVTTTVIDMARAAHVHGHAILDENHCAPHTPEEIVIDEVRQTESWHIIFAAANTAQERTILIESFVYDLPPRAIHGRHPDLFSDVATVYRMKRTVIERLQRNRDLCGLLQKPDADQCVSNCGGKLHAHVASNSVPGTIGGSR